MTQLDNIEAIEKRLWADADNLRANSNYANNEYFLTGFADQKAITYYEDPHEMIGKADFVMANPPFNVDEVDAEKIKNDPHLPFGLTGMNKKAVVKQRYARS